MGIEELIKILEYQAKLLETIAEDVDEIKHKMNLRGSKRKEEVKAQFATLREQLSQFDKTGMAAKVFDEMTKSVGG